MILCHLISVTMGKVHLLCYYSVLSLHLLNGHFCGSTCWLVTFVAPPADWSLLWLHILAAHFYNVLSIVFWITIHQYIGRRFFEWCLKRWMNIFRNMDQDPPPPYLSMLLSSFLMRILLNIQIHLKQSATYCSVIVIYPSCQFVSAMFIRWTNNLTFHWYQPNILLLGLPFLFQFYYL